MGYDFQAKETGIFTITVRSHTSHDSHCSVTTHKYYVQEGQTYDIEYGGVEIKER